MSDDEDIIIFKPDAGFDIRKAAPQFVQMMEELQKPLVIQFQSYTAEFEVGCSEDQIIEGYYEVLKMQMEGVPSNSNTWEEI